MFWLRDKGLIPWDWIVDETRAVIAYRHAPSVLDYLKDTVPLARINPWGDALPPVILCESRSLAGVLRDVAYEYMVQIAPTNGQCGGFLRTDVAPLLSPGQRVGYLGDQDLCGGQIEANTRKVLEELIGDELYWHRIAITEQQVERHQLPVISKPDRRYKPARWHDAVETEALGQTFIVNLVREWLDRLLPEPVSRADRAHANACRAGTNCTEAVVIQLDFFRLLIPPCGRSSEPFCVVEQNSRGDYRCLRCDCVAPSVTVPSS